MKFFGYLSQKTIKHFVAIDFLANTVYTTHVDKDIENTQIVKKSGVALQK
jgi:hypothetical protein